METQNRKQLVLTSYSLGMVVALAAVGFSGCQWAASGHNMQGVRLYKTGNYDAAIQEFQRAIAQEPNNPDAVYNTAATLHKLGVERNDARQLQQAEELYHQCLDLNGDHSDCYRGLAVLLVETNRSDKAFTLVNNWVRKSQQNPEAHIQLARLYEEFGDKEAAEQSLHNALGLDETNAIAWRALGHLRESDGHYDQAMYNYQRSMQYNAQQPQLATRIATLNRTLQSQATGPEQGRTRMVNVATPGVR